MLFYVLVTLIAFHLILIQDHLIMRTGILFLFFFCLSIFKKEIQSIKIKLNYNKGVSSFSSSNSSSSSSSTGSTSGNSRKWAHIDVGLVQRGGKRKYFFFKKEVENANCKRSIKTNNFEYPKELLISSNSSLSGRTRNLRTQLFLYFTKNKDGIDVLKELNGKNSLWYFTGYAKNVFYDNSFYHIIGFEKLEKIKKGSVFNKFFLNELKKRKLSVVECYEVKKFVTFYKKESDISKKDYILCSYNYFIYYVFNETNKKYYLIINGLNKENLIYEIDSIGDKQQLFNVLEKWNKNVKMNNIHMISLENKQNDIPFFNHNNNKKDLIRNGEPETKTSFFLSLKNIFSSTQNNNSSEKKLLGISSTVEEETLYPSKNIVVFSKENFMLTKKTYLQILKNFFIKNDEENSLFHTIFKNNDGYKLYVQSDKDKNSYYILKSTKISTKKFKQLNKLFANWILETEKNNDPAFILNKNLFNKFEIQLKRDEERKNNKEAGNGRYYNRSVYVSINEKQYSINSNTKLMKRMDECTFLSLAKHFLNNLIVSINL